ncbi:DDB1- and CUL4-associated factor 8-like isoform X2 [Myzus persicae]|uniref:DDB1- and CUL4-associated factor 8-like isoform X2 n=1 Tax=Myzus persicae TaxID=13164 RepID=UPI000B932E41|nr:DDB1- and CUL4-associated factor 8-like isoform X2 [Myzus persicae]
MSDTDFSSSDSDNNNVSPFFNQYFAYPQEYDSEIDVGSSDLEIDDSSDSEIVNSLNHLDSSSSDSEFNYSSEDLNCPDDSSHDSRNPSVLRLFRQRQIKKIKIAPPKSSYWCLPKELYNREIGQYNRRAQWGYKFYQSAVAVHKLKLSKQLKGHQGCVNSLDFNKTGDMIASGSDDCKICLWNWSNKKCLLNYNSMHTRNIFQTKFLTTHGDKDVISSGRDGLVVWSSLGDSNAKISKIIARHDRSCNKVGVHHETPYVVLSCGDDGIVKNIDVRQFPINENRRITNILHIRNARGSSMHLYGIDINPMKPYEFIVNGNDEYVRMYDKRQLIVDPVKMFHRELKNTKTEKADNNAVNSTDDSAINDTDDSDVDDIDDGAVNIADSFSASPNNVDSDYDEDCDSLVPHLKQITSAVYSYCGTEILASYSEDDIYLFDAYGRSNSVLRNYGGHINRMTVKGVNFYGPRSDYVVSGSDCGFIFIWDKKTEAIVQKKRADKSGCINVLEPHPHMPTLATSGLDRSIKIWEPLNESQEPNKKKLRLMSY